MARILPALTNSSEQTNTVILSEYRENNKASGKEKIKKYLIESVIIISDLVIFPKDNSADKAGKSVAEIPRKTKYGTWAIAAAAK